MARWRPRSWSPGSLLAALLIAPVAAAAPPSDINQIDAPRPAPKIYGGEPTGPCAWPTTVSVAGVCTGTLVDPEIVVYAGHCGPAAWVWFGERLDDPDAGRVVDTEYCALYPGYDGIATNTDFAFCKLVEPVTDVEIVPILMGCETSLLKPGAEVVAVGYGLDEFGGYGVKRMVGLPIVAISKSGEVEAGGDGKSICNGDSGGPLFLRLPSQLDPERSWRVFGVTSWGPIDCALPQHFGTLHSVVGWIEQRSGIDITPCHNADGSWQAGPGCGRFPLDPGAAGGAWKSGCDEQIVGGPCSSCGPPTIAEDLEPPVLEILEPANGATFSANPKSGAAPITVTAKAHDVGWGIEHVELRIDGVAQPGGTKRFPPWTWSATFPPGTFVLQLVGTDLAGNVGESKPVHFGVDRPSAPGSPTSGEGSNDAGETGGMRALEGERGCGCSTTAPRELGGSLLFMLALLGLRRRSAIRS
jgi:MYXO-CTERM domain-containing protein